VDSSLKCNKWSFEEYLIRRLVAERLARAIVESFRYLLDLPVSDLGEGTLLREVLPDQPVRVLIQPALPTRGRVREVEPGREPRREALVVRELAPVVRGDSVNASLERASEREAGRGDRLRCLALNFA
jgi:hypothetical protein